MTTDATTAEDFAALHDELRTVARDLLSSAKPGGTDGAPTPVDWSHLAEAGWIGLEVPEDLDGAGASYAETAVVLHELGRACALAPYLGTAVLGVGALTLLAPNPGRDILLHLASADARIAVALPTGDAIPSVASATPPDLPFHLDATPDGLRLSGSAAFVPDAADADHLLLLARGADGPVVVSLTPDAQGLAIDPQPVLDATRSLATVTADGVAVDDAAVWSFAGDPAAAIRRLHDRGALAVACDSLGVAEAMLETTVAYVGIRQQFGRAIGSFQAVKHACADMLVQVTVGRELVTAAVRALTSDADLTDGDAVSTAVSMAKSHVCAAAVDVVGKALQLHGGIGYTWEAGVHAYLKRAMLNRDLFGSPEAHRRRLAARYR